MWKGLQEGLKPLSKGEEERLRRVFDRIDKDADGQISASGTVVITSEATSTRYLTCIFTCYLFEPNRHARLTREVLQICGRH